MSWAARIKNVIGHRVVKKNKLLIGEVKQGPRRLEPVEDQIVVPKVKMLPSTQELPGKTQAQRYRWTLRGMSSDDREKIDATGSDVYSDVAPDGPRVGIRGASNDADRPALRRCSDESRNRCTDP